MTGRASVIVIVATSIAAASNAMSASAALPATRASDIARAILACWRPPYGGGEITLSLSLRRDGTIIGIPRVTYVEAGADSDDVADLKASIADAVRGCTPVRLSGPLQSAIAGQVLRIRFVAERAAHAGTATVIWTGT